MRDVGKELLESLNLLKGSGSFVTSHADPFIFPGLSIQGLGEVAYPINDLQAKALIQVAQKAPFGKGVETVIDEKVRSAWEIDAEKLHFKGKQWDLFLQRALTNIKPQLGIEDFDVEAHLYKMLIYEERDFFLSHRDTEKEKGMFGTLIIGLPSNHSGGELVVRFDGDEKSVHFDDPANNYKIPYVAFYADCEHEIKPLKQGYRLCLVYNLVQKKSEKKIELEPLSSHVLRLAEILKEGAESQRFSPGIVLLGHQYTPENFSKDQLKLNDRPRAEALIRAAGDAGYYAKMCLVTSFLTGTPAYGGYDYEDTLDEDMEMDEVHDGWVSIEHWLQDGPPPLRQIEVDEDDLMATFKLNEGEPMVKENTGYMGNYGPDLMHWYHYGAVVFWPKKDQRELLLSQETSNQLEWVGYYNTIRDQLSYNEIALCETILNGLLNNEEILPKADYNVIAEWLIGYKDNACFEKLGYPLLLHFFQYINPDSWVKLVETYPSRHFEKIFGQVGKEKNSALLYHLLSIGVAIIELPSGKALFESQMKALPDYFSLLSSRPQQQQPLLNLPSIKNLLHLENKLPQENAWVDAIHDLIIRCKKRKYVNSVILSTILTLDNATPLSNALFHSCRDELRHRVKNKPQPPANWSRPLPDISQNSNLQTILADFLQSPVEQVFDFRKNQQERNELESAIQSLKIDLRTETIRKGSPHTLRIIKTQAAYEKQMKEWHEDVVLLDQVMKKKPN